jgi:general secretion pathway protein M
MIQLTPRQSKAAALTVLILITLLAVALVSIPPWLLNRRYEAAIEDSSSRLERYSRVVGMRDGLLKRAVEVKALELSHHFLNSATPALAAAELQEKVTSILGESGVRANSIQILPHKDEGLYRQVSVALQLSAPLSAVKAMLYGLESAHPYLFIDNFSVRMTNMLAVRTELAAEPDVVVQFDVTGFALKGQP